LLAGAPAGARRTTATGPVTVLIGAFAVIYASESTVKISSHSRQTQSPEDPFRAAGAAGTI
jgi:hypothetical protein